jgi:hypothetical protein
MIVWVGLDLDRAPLRDWSGSDSLLVETLRGRRGARDAGRAGETARGTLDLAGQLRQAIDHFPGVFPIPFEVIAGLGVLYVACLYPLDWWLVSGRRRGDPARGLQSSWLAWLSLPLLVAAPFLAPGRWQLVVMVASVVMVLVVELLNSAIEALADALSLEHHPMLGRAKDLGSNNFQFYAREMNASVEEKLVLLDGLRQAVQAQGLAGGRGQQRVLCRHLPAFK